MTYKINLSLKDEILDCHCACYIGFYIPCEHIIKILTIQQKRI
jgi:hypothetical protein